MLLNEEIYGSTTCPLQTELIYSANIRVQSSSYNYYVSVEEAQNKLSNCSVKACVQIRATRYMPFVNCHIVRVLLLSHSQPLISSNNCINNC